jgi:hypothetical protein
VLITWFVRLQKTDQEICHSSCLATTDCSCHLQIQHNNIRFSKTTAMLGPAHWAVNWQEVEHSSRGWCQRFELDGLASTQRLLADDLQVNHIFFYCAENATNINCILLYNNMSRCLRRHSCLQTPFRTKEKRNDSPFFVQQSHIIRATGALHGSGASIIRATSGCGSGSGSSKRWERDRVLVV